MEQSEGTGKTQAVIAAEPPEPAVAEDAQFFNELANDVEMSDDVGEPVEQPVAPVEGRSPEPVPQAVPAPAEPPKPTTPPGQPAAPPTAIVEGAPVSPAAAPAPATPQPVAPATPVPTSAPAAPPPPTAEELRQRREKIRSDIERNYAIDDEDARALVTEPEKVLPKLASRIYMDVFDSVYQAVSSMLPGAIAQQQQVAELARRADEDFYARWPVLRKDEYRPVIQQMGAAFRQANPQADLRTTIEAVGLMSAYQLGLQEALAPQPASTPPPTAQGATPPAAAAPIPARPYAPVLPGGAPPASRPAASNPWTELAEFVEDFDS